MAFCDPPYAVSYVGKTAKKLTIKNDDLGAASMTSCATPARTCWPSRRAPSTSACPRQNCTRSSGRSLDAGGHWSTFVIWAKHHFTLGRSDYQRQYEPILMAGVEERITSGAAPGIRATSGSSTGPWQIWSTRP